MDARIAHTHLQSNHTLKVVTLTKLSSAQAGEGGMTWSEARGCGVRGRSWGAFCGGVEADARVLVCRERKTNVHAFISS